MRALALVLLVACGSSPETIEAERSGVAPCNVDGHVIDAPAVGDAFEACHPDLQSAVISNGEVRTVVTGECWRFDVVKLTGGTLPLVIQLRDYQHQTICTPLTVP
jgi:hypothetical protein